MDEWKPLFADPSGGETPLVQDLENTRGIEEHSCVNGLAEYLHKTLPLPSCRKITGREFK